INDSKGHRAGDAMLKHIVNGLQSNLRCYEPVVRLSGDEFVCTVSNATIEIVRHRFAQISAELRLTPEDGSISVGFAELAHGDMPMDLIDRARDGDHRASNALTPTGGLTASWRVAARELRGPSRR